MNAPEFRQLLGDLRFTEALQAVGLQAYDGLSKAEGIAGIVDAVQLAEREVLRVCLEQSLDAREGVLLSSVIGDQAQRRHAEVWPR